MVDPPERLGELTVTEGKGTETRSGVATSRSAGVKASMERMDTRSPGAIERGGG